jgi:TonB family protein
MNNIVTYLVQSAISLMVLYSLYWIFLRRETFFHVNRFYLLSTLFLSMVIPVFNFRIFTGGPISSMIILLDPVIITPEKIERARSGHLSWFEITGVIYLTGVVIFTIRLFIQMIQLVLIVHRSKSSRQEGMNIVFVDRGYSPFSFFNMVFIRKEYYVDGKLTPVLTHEKVHIHQFHTLDLLLIEIVTIVQWFNPFAWFLGKSMKSIHEFLADEGVLKEGFLKSDYQTLILNEAMGIQVNNLTNNFNVSLLKNRISMMTKSRSGAWAVSKVLITLPAILLLVFFFSASPAVKMNAQETKPKTGQADKLQKQSEENTTNQQVEEQPSYPGGSTEMSKFIIQNIKYPEAAKKKGIQGKVFVNFTVEKDGSISDAKVTKGIGSGCDEEALRVVKLMPKWIPGKIKGKPVSVRVTLPVMFALDGDKEKKEEKKP